MMKKQEAVPAEAKKAFDKEAFKKEVVSNVKLLFRKTLDEANPQEVFQAVLQYRGARFILQLFQPLPICL